MKIKWKSLLVCLVIPLAVGGLSSFVTKDAMEEFSRLRQPPLSPPMWLFPVVWTLLFLLMGLASYLVYHSTRAASQKRSALGLYALQLAVNFVWPILFFNLNWWLAAFLWLVMLWALIWFTAVSFHRCRPLAGMLLAPYLGWVAFAGYLNFGIYLLN